MLMELFLTVIKMMEEVENQLEQHWRAALKRHMYDLVKKKKTTKTCLIQMWPVRLPYWALRNLMNSVPQFPLL